MEVLTFLEQMAALTHFDSNTEVLLNSVSMELKECYVTQNSEGIRNFFSKTEIYPNEVGVISIKQT